VIVGAGVAGCTAALCLQAGTRALLVDRVRPGSERCCGVLLASDAQAALASLGLKLPDDLRVRPEPQLVRVHDLDSGRQQSYRRNYINVDRARFDAWLLDLAKEHAEVSLQTSFVGSSADGVLLRRKDQTVTVHTRLLIGADGANSKVRRQCFAEHPGPSTMLALQARLAQGEPLKTHVVVFARALTSFYAWAIPKAETVLIGCAFEEKDGAGDRFERILAWYGEAVGLDGKVLERSARRLSRPRVRSDFFPGRGNVLLAGEAAGLVSPSSGEGISFALSSGAAVGRAAVATVPDRAYERSFRHLSRRAMAKTLKAGVIYSPRLRPWALRLPWYP
jgi:geranylgeranyl reductase